MTDPRVTDPRGGVDLPASDPELRAVGQEASPTWELELFISGALIFALMQLPGAVERFFSSIEPHATETAYAVIFFVSLYIKAIAFALLGTFVVHGVVRASWVALMGLHSVFPRGIQWDRLKAGPVTLALYKELIPPLPRTIAKLDNFASGLFSFAFLVVGVFAFTILMSGVVGGVAYGLDHALTGGRHTKHWFFGILAVFALVPGLAAFIDKRVGPRMSPDSRGRRVLERVIRVSSRVNAVRFTGPILIILMTNVGRGKTLAVFYLAIAGLIAATVVDRLANRDALSVNGYQYFGSSTGHGIDWRAYENQRDPEKPYPRIPSIQSDVIRDPYVKLFIPYAPRRHNAAIAKRCPDAKPLQSIGVDFGANPPVADSIAMPVLRCLAKLHAIAVNGVPRPDLDLLFAEQPSRGAKGVMAYIPTDSLPRGRNSITVMPIPPETLPKDTTNAAWNRPFVIWFWLGG